MNKLPSTVTVTPGGEEIPSKEVLQLEKHFLLAQVDTGNRDISLNFSSREAMYEFAKALLQEAVFGASGQMELYPLLVDGRSLVVNGTRLVEGSSRIFVSYSDDNSGGIKPKMKW